MKRILATFCLTIAVLFGSAGVRFALTPCPSDQNQYYDNCFGTYTYADGRKYVGEYRNGKKHGQGTTTYPNGTKYVGEWRDGEYNGQGTRTDANGRIEEGVWKNKGTNTS
jgi:antitoxin component YwqK of YwqJK toxin-antitoxin module